jgi:hypothetical protein
MLGESLGRDGGVPEIEIGEGVGGPFTNRMCRIVGCGRPTRLGENPGASPQKKGGSEKSSAERAQNFVDAVSEDSKSKPKGNPQPSRLFQNLWYW